MLTHLPDGSYLSDLDGLSVRIIEADLTMRGADGTRVGDRYRLITTLLDPDRFPAEALIGLYHERWEIESAYLALRHTMLDGHVLRSGDRAGLEQEVWALLTLYQLLRMAMVDAVETRPGTNPDRASFTTALQAARDQLIIAARSAPTRASPPTCSASSAGPCWPPCSPPAEPATAPARSSARPPATSTATTAAPPPRPPSPPSTSRAHPTAGPRRRDPAGAGPTPRPRPPTRRQRVTALLGSDPRRAWTGANSPTTPGPPAQHADPALRVGPARLHRPHRTGSYALATSP